MQRIVIIMLFTALVACGREPDYVTERGVEVFILDAQTGDPGPEAIDATVEAFEHIMRQSLDVAGTRVDILPEPWGCDENLCIHGMYFGKGDIAVSWPKSFESDCFVAQSSLVHEWVHHWEYLTGTPYDYAHSTERFTEKTPAMRDYGWGWCGDHLWAGKVFPANDGRTE